MALTTTQKTEAYQFFIVAFGAATGVEYMNQLNDAYNAGMTTKQIVNVYTTKPQFEALYPRFDTNEQFAERLIENVVGASATAAAKTEAKADVAAALNAGWTKGDVVFQIFTNLAAKAPTDAQWGNTSLMLANKVAVAQYITETLLVDTTDLAKLGSYIASVTEVAATVDAAKLAAQGANGQTFTLTNNIDVQTAHVFTSTPVYVPGGNDFINSLQDEDKLTGTAATDDRLNVTLGSVNDAAEGTIVPTLTSIEIVNVEVTGSTAGINFQDATGTNTINVNRITQTNALVTFDDLKAEVTSLSVNNATRSGAVNFLYKEEVLTETTGEALTIGLNDARLQALNLAEGSDGGADAGFFFETNTINATGINDIDTLTLQANGREDVVAGVAADTTKQTLTINAGAAAGAAGSFEVNVLNITSVDTLSIVANQRVDIAADKALPIAAGNGINSAGLEVLNVSGGSNVRIDGLEGQVGAFADNQGLAINAGTMTGNLRVGIVAGTSGDDRLVVTSGSGNDEIVVFGNLGGDVSTQNGNDIISVNANMLGTASINAGEGANTVTAQNMLGAAVSDKDLASNGGFDDIQAATISTGSGIDTVTVGDLGRQSDWDNITITDGNNNDQQFVVGASINTDAGNDVITVRSVAEGASVNAGKGDDTFSVSLTSVATVLAADSQANLQTLVTATQGVGTGRTDEVNRDGTVNFVGAVVDLGNGTNDVASFTEADTGIADTILGTPTETSLAATLIVGQDAELRGAETVNVTALDRVNVTDTTTMADQDAVTTGVQNDINNTVLGTQRLNLTILNQIEDTDTADTVVAHNTVTGSTVNDNNATDGLIYADVMRINTALTSISLDSQEAVLQTGPATEVYEAGTRTTFTLDNMRANVGLSLKAKEATGVTTGDLADDTLLTINTTTGVAAANAATADVTLNLNYDNARGLVDVASLNVDAASGAFDLDLHIGATLTDTAATNAAGDNGNAASTTDDDTMRIENFAVKFADANSHSIDANGFGDVDFRGTRAPVAANDVSSTAATSFTVWSAAAAGAGKTIAIDAVNADTIRVLNVDGTAVTAANVTLRVDDENNYNVVTGAGADVFDFRADNVRSDDIDTVLNRADFLDAGTGRDTLIVNGNDDLGLNNGIEDGVASTIIDDDVFATIRGVEKILVDGNYNAGAEDLDITLDEQAAITGVDTVALVGSEQQTLNLEVGNNFVLATTADNANGELTTAANAVVVDASAHTGQTLLSIESKDDDTDIQLVNMDVRVNSKGGTVFNLVNSGSTSAQVELRVYTADEADGHTISSGNAGNADGLVDINVTTGSFDKLVVLEGATANDNSGTEEGAMTIALDAAWTGTAFEVDASAVLNTDANIATGGATITAALGDTATLTIAGTQNSDTITGGRGADTIDGNSGNDTITGDEVVNNQELEVVTFAATYDAGDVVSVTHVTALGVSQTLTATVSADNTAGAAIAEALAAFDNTGAENIAGVTVAGTRFSDATSTFDGVTRQLRLTGATAGTDYAVSATTFNAGDNVRQLQTLAVNDDGPFGDGWTATIVWNGATYDLNNTATGFGFGNVTTGAAFSAAVVALGGVVNYAGGDTITIQGPASGAAFPQITQVTVTSAGDIAALTLVAGDLGTDQADPTVVTETLARTVLGGADTINGGAGNDTIAGLIGADKLDGGDGVDTLDYSLSLGGVTVNLAANTASGGDAAGDTISNFENVTGSAYNDTLTGSAVANTLDGGVGDDTLSGGAGADTLNGGAGADTITGGTGNDIINVGSDAVEDTVIVASGDGVDTITGFVAGTDTIRFSDFADRDLAPATLLQQTAAAGSNALVSGANTELLVVTGADLQLAGVANITTTTVAAVLAAAFDVNDATGRLADGKVVFAIQANTDGTAGVDSTVFGYYTDVGTDDTIVAADIEIIGVVSGSLLTNADFWLPTV